MATTDNSLQVINSMTQETMNSLKNSEGKIPDLANQLVMTDDEDSNFSCLKTEIIYDGYSSDAEKNWGYTSGIQGGVTISGKDFSKYSALIIHTDQLNLGLTLIYDLNSTSSEQSVSGLSADNLAVMTVKCAVTSTSFTVSAIGYWNSSGSFANRNENANYTIRKIEGILKTPAMIYTGAELNEGNGIKIEDGVVRVNENVMGVPSSGSISISATAGTTYYTAPANGYVVVTGTTGSTGYSRILAYNKNTESGNINDAIYGNSDVGYGQSDASLITTCVCKKGDPIVIIINNVSSISAKFVYGEV